jgi:tRNA-dihydrouridine synthase C
VARPDLARQIVAAKAGEEVVEMTWADMQPMLQEFWRQSVAQLTEKQAPGRLKQWLAMLTRNYPEAVELFTALRRETGLEQVSRLLGMKHPDPA